MEKPDFGSQDLFDFEGTYHGLIAAFGPSDLKKIRAKILGEREFLRRELEPIVLAEDRKHMEAPSCISWELLRSARWSMIYLKEPCMASNILSL